MSEKHRKNYVIRYLDVKYSLWLANHLEKKFNKMLKNATPINLFDKGPRKDNLEEKSLSQSK